MIFGGGWFVMTWLNQLAAGGDFAVRVVSTLLAMFGVSSVFVGAECLRDRSWAIRASAVIWALQIPSFASLLVSYRFFEGAELRLGLNLEPHAFYDLRMGCGLVAQLERNGSITYFGVNALALAATLYYARRLRRDSAPL